MTGIGPAVRCPRVRDRVDQGSERIRFSSAILPPYARRSKSLEVLIPILYLKGVSTGDFTPVATMQPNPHERVMEPGRLAGHPDASLYSSWQTKTGKPPPSLQPVKEDP